MLEANKAKLANALRKRLVAIRHQELEYYRSNCRLLGDLSALVAGLAYQGIRYHYYLERKHSYMLAQGDAIEEVVFLTLLTCTMAVGLQTVLIAMLVAMLAPSLALRGPEGSLHDAVLGMRDWNAGMLALFLGSLVMLQIAALSFTSGHAQMDLLSRSALSCTMLLSLALTLRYAGNVIHRFRLPPEAAVSGAFFEQLDGDGAGQVAAGGGAASGGACVAPAPLPGGGVGGVGGVGVGGGELLPARDDDSAWAGGASDRGASEAWGRPSDGVSDPVLALPLSLRRFLLGTPWELPPRESAVPGARARRRGRLLGSLLRGVRRRAAYESVSTGVLLEDEPGHGG